MSFLRTRILSALIFVMSLIKDWNNREIHDSGLITFSSLTSHHFSSSTSHPLVIAFLRSGENDGIIKEVKKLLKKTKAKRKSIWTTMGEFPWSPIYFARKGDKYPLNYFILTVVDLSVASRAEEAIINVKSAFNGLQPSDIWILKEENTRLSNCLSFDVYNSVDDILCACKGEFVK